MTSFSRTHQPISRTEIAATTLLAVILLLGTKASGATAQERKSAPPCGSELNFDDSSDVNAPEEYQQAIRQLLQERNFKELDCIADAARASKSRFSGGNWKLHRIYYALSEIEGHSTEEDWGERLALLQEWVAGQPQSITARVALADAYVSYAWSARGDGASDTVTGSGWRLFSERLDKAKETLEDAKSLQNKCQEWFVVMQQIALGQGWEVPDAHALFDQAVAFEPSYYSYYRMLANFMLPKWNGQDGDTAKFAEESADRVGGDEGNIVYFQIAEEIACPCEEPEFARLSWPRIQKGFDALEKHYGVSLAHLNQFALMAMKNQDVITADAAFKRIGDNWEKDTWKTEDYFHSNRDQAAHMAPQAVRGRALKAEAAINTKTPEGTAYKKLLDQKFDEFMRACAQSTPGATDEGKIDLVVKVGADGVPEDLWMPQFKFGGLGYCIFQRLRQAHFEKQNLFPAPPKPSYGVEIELDSAPFVAKAVQ